MKQKRVHSFFCIALLSRRDDARMLKHILYVCDRVRAYVCMFVHYLLHSERESKQTDKQNEQTNEPANQWCGCNRFCQYDKVMRCAVCYHLSICLSEKQCERAIEKWMQDRRMERERERKFQQE